MLDAFGSDDPDDYIAASRITAPWLRDGDYMIAGRMRTGTAPATRACSRAAACNG